MQLLCPLLQGFGGRWPGRWGIGIDAQIQQTARGTETAIEDGGAENWPKSGQAQGNEIRLMQKLYGVAVGCRPVCRYHRGCLPRPVTGNTMLTLLSPAKTLDFDTPPVITTATQPGFTDDSAALVDILKGYSPDQLGALMKLSPALAQLNVQRFHDWRLPFTAANAKQAILAFKGDVYTGLDADTLTAQQLAFAQQHVRILSGLYGVLRPLDLMQPYRLEMGTKLANPQGKDLYAFWGDKITAALNAELAQQQADVVVNLASNEYFGAVKPKQLQARLITPVFKDEKNGQYKIISFYAKKARGLMTRWIIEQQLGSPVLLTDFNVAGYRFSEEDSRGDTLVFKRAEKDIPHA